MDWQLKLGLDLKGGVHLVLRVQTDDALRHETEAESERLRERVEDGGHLPPAWNIHGRPRPSSRSRGFTPSRTRPSARRQQEVRPTSTASRRRRRLHLHHEAQRPGDAARGGGHPGPPDDRAARQRARRDRAEHRAARRNGDQILVQLPGVSDIDRAKEIIGSTGLLQLKIVEQGPVSSQRGAPGQRPGALGHGDRARRQRRARRAAHRVLHGEARAAVEGATCAAPGRGSTRTAARP